LIGAKELEEAEAGVPPFGRQGVVSYELPVCGLGGLQDAVG
jgi:hypothetical protein